MNMKIPRRLTPILAHDIVLRYLQQRYVDGENVPMRDFPHDLVKYAIRHRLGGDDRTVNKHFNIFLLEKYIYPLDPYGKSELQSEIQPITDFLPEPQFQQNPKRSEDIERHQKKRYLDYFPKNRELKPQHTHKREMTGLD